MRHANLWFVGTPIQFFISQMHTEYLGCQICCPQFFIEERDLTFE
jgi:hypothetical protein